MAGGEGEPNLQNFLVDLFISIEIKRTPSLILSALMIQNHQSTSELMRNTGLSKGYVASGLNHWRYEGWIESIEGVQKVKGRNPHIWILTLSHEEIIHRLTAKINNKMQLLNDAIRSIERWLA